MEGNQQADSYKEGRELWNALREIHKTRPYDLDQLLAAWVRAETEKLASPGAREDFAELCSAGCSPHALVASMTLVRYSPHLERLWNVLVGPREERQKTTRVLEDAAEALETLFDPVIAASDEQTKLKFAQIGRIHPKQMASELRFYIRTMNLASLLSAETKTHSLPELSKYLLSGYVDRMTGRPHDRNVSSLIAEVLGQEEYNEVAHRMWRNRNYDRLNEHLSWLVNFLVAMTSSYNPAST